jgi:hypothetical protein
VSQYECQSHFPAVAKAPDQLSKRERCAFVGFALAEIDRRSSLETGLSPRGRPVISSARIDEGGIIDSATGESLDWWVVTFRLPDQEFNLEVIIEKGTGRTAVRPAAKEPLFEPE